MLEKLAIRDKDWRKMAFQICKDKSKADDLVQEMYLKFANYDKEVNDFYIFFAIRSIYLDEFKKDKFVKFVDDILDRLEFCNEDYDFNIDELQQINIDLIKKSIPSLPYFERELVSITLGVKFDKESSNYVDGIKINQKELSRQTGINYMTINKTILKTKENLKNQLWQIK
jgi:hypothetical protein